MQVRKFTFFLVAAIAYGQGRRVDDAALKTAGQNAAEWLTYGHDYGETRYSPLSLLNAGNVSRLGLSWSYDVGPGGGIQEATPLVWNGTIYAITNWSVVFAVDARTGKEKWRWDPEVNQTTVRPKICCGVSNRGIAMYQGKIIAPVIDGRLEALDAETGKVVWESRVAYPQDNYTLTMAPRVVKGKVIIGVSGSEFPVRGFFAAYDAGTGQFAWRFYTVPGDPSKGFENEAMRKAAATWEGEWWRMGGGGTVWDALAYDPDLDLLYVGTGNAGPWPEELRRSKGKDNLYVACILAVKPDTGKLEWYYQVVPDDSWDFDSVQQLLLTDLTIRGQKRKVLMQANKNGFYYVIDRATGKFISGQPFVKVNWAKGLNEATGRPIVNPEALYTEKESVQITPGPGGAHNWPPMSFNPATGLVYIPSQAGGEFNYAVQPNFEYKPGQLNMGIVFGAPPPPPGGRGGAAAGGTSTAGGTNTGAAPEVANAAAAAPPAPKPPEAVRRKPPASIGPDLMGGQLIAWDPVEQKERWHMPGGGSIGGGTVTTAGNLVLQSLPDGRLMAYSADKGVKLLEVQTGLRGGMGPPVTYQLDGKQYVALLGGNGTVVGPFGGGNGGNNNAPRPKLLVFELDGKAPLPGAAKP